MKWKGVIIMGIIQLFLSNATADALTSDINTLLDKYADEFNLEKSLVHAISMQESKKNYAALRYEPQLRTQKWYLDLIPEKDRNDKYSYFSMGVMQILYGIARSEGFTGTPFDLMTPDNSIKFGCKYIKTLIKRYYRLDKVISAYNQGNISWNDLDKDKIHDANEKYWNQDYVDSVYKIYKGLGGKN